jgi:hypothetical protein
MAIYGGERDISLFRIINDELINKMIDTQVLYYPLAQNSMVTNIYGESSTKVYDKPILLHCLISMDDNQWQDDIGLPNVTIKATFSFLKDYLLKQGISLQIGNMIEYCSRFFEIDNLNENQRFAEKSQDEWFNKDADGNDLKFGWNVSVVCTTHMTRLSTIQVVESINNDVNEVTNNTVAPNN